MDFLYSGAKGASLVGHTGLVKPWGTGYSALCLSVGVSNTLVPRSPAAASALSSERLFWKPWELGDELPMHTSGGCHH